MVQKMVLTNRRDDSEDHSHHPGEDGRHHRQLHGIGEGLHNHGGDTPVVLVALAHVAAEEPSQIGEELLHHRLVQIHGLRQSVNGLLIDMLSEERCHRIARNNPEHDENQKNDTNQNRNGSEDSFYNLFHVCTPLRQNPRRRFSLCSFVSS